MLRARTENLETGEDSVEPEVTQEDSFTEKIAKIKKEASSNNNATENPET